MKLKRIFAYILDMFLVTLISSFAFALFTSSTEAAEYDKLYNESMDLIMSTGSGVVNEDTLLDLTYRMQMATKTSQIISVGLLILYFGVFAYLMKGQTLGKKLLKIQVVPVNGKTLNPPLFMLRAIIITNFNPKLISLVSLMICSKNTWYLISNVTSNAQTIILFIIVGFMIFRDDERGLHDIICQTKVTDSKVPVKE